MSHSSQTACHSGITNLGRVLKKEEISKHYYCISRLVISKWEATLEECDSKASYLEYITKPKGFRCLWKANVEKYSTRLLYFSSKKETVLLKTGKGYPYMFAYTMPTFVLMVSRHIRCRCDTYIIYFFSRCTHRKVVLFVASVEFVCCGFMISQLLSYKASGSILLSIERHFDSTVSLSVRQLTRTH